MQQVNALSSHVYLFAVFSNPRFFAGSRAGNETRSFKEKGRPGFVFSSQYLEQPFRTLGFSGVTMAAAHQPVPIPVHLITLCIIG